MQIYFYSGKYTKSVYILCIYTERVHKMQKNRSYPMGILWLCYGYPMEESGKRQVLGRIILQAKLALSARK